MTSLYSFLPVGFTQLGYSTFGSSKKVPQPLPFAVTATLTVFVVVWGCFLFKFLTSKSLSRQAWCQFCRAQLPKVLRTHDVLTILTSKSFSRSGVAQILSTSWAADPPQLPLFGPTFPSPRSQETMEKHSISRNSYPPKHLCCQTSMLQDLPATFSIV